MLVVTIMLMGGASTLVGVLPTYETIGVWAPILLVFLRLCQGFGAGAEQAGATVLMAEYSPVKSRGFFAALPFIGIQAGTLLAAGVFAYPRHAAARTCCWAGPGEFRSCASIFLDPDRPLHPAAAEGEPHLRRAREARAGRREAAEGHLRQSLGSVLRGIGLRMAENGGSYMFNSLAVAYATGTVMVTSPSARSPSWWPP